MDRHPLAGVQSKLERASEHLDLLDAETRAFFDRQPYLVHGEFDPQSSSYVFRLQVREEPPLRLGVILGDFAHCLRSALDHVIWQLVRHHGNQPRWHNKFPIYLHETDFIEQVVCTKRGPLTGIDPHSDEWAFIERQQPYNTPDRIPDSYLANLRWLSNEDKHHVVHPTTGFLQGSADKRSFTLVGNEDAGTLTTGTMATGRRMEDGAEVVCVALSPVGPNPQVEMQGSYTFGIAFGERWMKSEVLPHLHEYVVKVCAALATVF